MRTKSLITAILLLLIISSCEEQTSISRTDLEITELLKNDQEFQTYFIESARVQSEISRRILEINSDGNIDILINSNDINKLMEGLEMPSDLIKNHGLLLTDIFVNLTDRYPELNIRTEEEIGTILQNAIIEQSSESILSNIFQNARTADACDDQFESSFNSIHAAFDSGVRTCLVVGLATGGAGLIPCNAANVYNTAVAVGNAIDAHTNCKNEQ